MIEPWIVLITLTVVTVWFIYQHFALIHELAHDPMTQLAIDFIWGQK